MQTATAPPITAQRPELTLHNADAVGLPNFSVCRFSSPLPPEMDREIAPEREDPPAAHSRHGGERSPLAAVELNSPAAPTQPYRLAGSASPTPLKRGQPPSAGALRAKRERRKSSFGSKAKRVSFGGQQIKLYEQHENEWRSPTSPEPLGDAAEAAIANRTRDASVPDDDGDDAATVGVLEMPLRRFSDTLTDDADSTLGSEATRDSLAGAAGMPRRSSTDGDDAHTVGSAQALAEAVLAHAAFGPVSARGGGGGRTDDTSLTRHSEESAAPASGPRRGQPTPSAESIGFFMDEDVTRGVGYPRMSVGITSMSTASAVTGSAANGTLRRMSFSTAGRRRSSMLRPPLPTQLKATFPRPEGTDVEAEAKTTTASGARGPSASAPDDTDITGQLPTLGALLDTDRGDEADAMPDRVADVSDGPNEPPAPETASRTDAAPLDASFDEAYDRVRSRRQTHSAEADDEDVTGEVTARIPSLAELMADDRTASSGRRADARRSSALEGSVPLPSSVPRRPVLLSPADITRGMPSLHRLLEEDDTADDGAAVAAARLPLPTAELPTVGARKPPPPPPPPPRRSSPALPRWPTPLTTADSPALSSANRYTTEAMRRQRVSDRRRTLAAGVRRLSLTGSRASLAPPPPSESRVSARTRLPWRPSPTPQRPTPAPAAVQPTATPSPRLQLTEATFRDFLYAAGVRFLDDISNRRRATSFGVPSMGAVAPANTLEQRVRLVCVVAQLVAVQQQHGIDALTSQGAQLQRRIEHQEQETRQCWLFAHLLTVYHQPGPSDTAGSTVTRWQVQLKRLKNTGRLRARIGWYQWRGQHEHALQQALALERAALEADATQMRGLAESLRATAAAAAEDAAAWALGPLGTSSEAVAAEAAALERAADAEAQARQALEAQLATMRQRREALYADKSALELRCVELARERDRLRALWAYRGPGGSGGGGGGDDDALAALQDTYDIVLSVGNVRPVRVGRTQAVFRVGDDVFVTLRWCDDGEHAHGAQRPVGCALQVNGTDEAVVDTVRRALQPWWQRLEPDTASVCRCQRVIDATLLLPALVPAVLREAARAAGQARALQQQLQQLAAQCPYRVRWEAQADGRVLLVAELGSVAAHAKFRVALSLQPDSPAVTVADVQPLIHPARCPSITQVQAAARKEEAPTAGAVAAHLLHTLYRQLQAA